MLPGGHRDPAPLIGDIGLHGHQIGVVDVLAQPLQIGGWRPEGTAKDAVEALVSTLTFLGDTAIWVLICVAPIALILGVPGFYVGRAILRRRRAKNEDGVQESE